MAIFSSEHMIFIFYTYAKKKFIIKDSWTHLVKKKYADSGLTPILPQFYPDYTPIVPPILTQILARYV